MMNLDGARAGEGILSPAKNKKESKQPDSNDPVFSSEEKPLNIEVPEGWKIGESKVEG